MSRIQATFERLARERRKALIPYVTAGDPKPAVTVPLMHALAKAGADVIELGVPFSDPMADGPVIQRSGERALKHQVGLDQVVGFVAEFRRGCVVGLSSSWSLLTAATPASGESSGWQVVPFVVVRQRRSSNV